MYDKNGFEWGRDKHGKLMWFGSVGFYGNTYEEVYRNILNNISEVKAKIFKIVNDNVGVLNEDIRDKIEDHKAHIRMLERFKLKLEPFATTLFDDYENYELDWLNNDIYE